MDDRGNKPLYVTKIGLWIIINKKTPNPYEPPSVPPQEEDKININGAYKEFTLWGILLAALFFLFDSIRAIGAGIVKNILLVIRYVIDLNH